MMIFVLFLLPIAFLFLTAHFILKKPGSKLARISKTSLVCYLVGIFFGVIDIFSSRSSTAAIGLLFLPYYAFVPAAFGALFSATDKKSLRASAFILLVSTYSYAIFATLQVRQKNQVQDIESLRQREEISKNKNWVLEIEKSLPEKGAQLLAEKAAQTTDRTWLIPIAESPLASPELLDKLSRSNDMGVILSVVRNPKTNSDSLARIFKTQKEADYFFADLAANPQTPDAILHEIFGKAGTNSGILIGLGKNPHLPPDLVSSILDSKDILALAELARNPSASCIATNAARHRIEAMPKETLYYSTALGWSEAAYSNCRPKK
jgi:hypothetical protein